MEFRHHTQLEKFKRYRIVHRSETQRFNRVSVMVYLGDDPLKEELVFSARPVYGTQGMPYSWVKSIDLVPEDTTIIVNQRA